MTRLDLLTLITSATSFVAALAFGIIAFALRTSHDQRLQAWAVISIVLSLAFFLAFVRDAMIMSEGYTEPSAWLNFAIRALVMLAALNGVRAFVMAKP
jgi:hypothetical protein